jgi:DNA-binding SARP family transcriptional activator
MRFGVLGRVVALRDGQPLPLGPRKQRLLFAVLLARVGRAVTAGELVDALWGPAPPASALDNLYLYVHRLRRTLGGDRLLNRARSGYVLSVRPGESDECRFTDLTRAARRKLEAGDALPASEYLREALSLWRGGPYEDVADAPALGIEVHRLEELRLTAVEQRIEADLLLGKSGELVGELAELVDRHPFRERFTAQLMRALYRAGRQAEALSAYHRTRTVLGDQLGLTPGPELRALETAILTGSLP